jgi:outer membrane lipoprotein-sorting protein
MPVLRPFFHVALLAMVFVSSSTVYAKETLEEQAYKVEKRLNDIKGFQAEFQQVFHNNAMGTEETSSGSVVMQKPLKMRWD